MFPAFPEVGHQSQKICIAAQAIETGIALEPRIAGEAIVGGGAQPAHRLLRPFHQGIRGPDRVGRMMEMPEILALPDGALNAALGERRLTGIGMEQSLHGTADAALVARIVAQVIAYQDRRLMFATELK